MFQKGFKIIFFLFVLSFFSVQCGPSTFDWDLLKGGGSTTVTPSVGEKTKSFPSEDAADVGSLPGSSSDPLSDPVPDVGVSVGEPPLFDPGLPDSEEIDNDGDGFAELDGDCNDSNVAIFPGAPEGCEGIDNDCDGTIDEGCPGPPLPPEDIDDDGDGFTEVGGDCDDTNPLISPSAPEVCDGADNNCDSVVDEGCPGPGEADNDGDGFTGLTGDCDDTDATIFSGAPEVCDGVDNDCDGQINEGVLLTWYRDFDGDTFGQSVLTIEACTPPSGYVGNASDCNDLNPNINPNAAEVCDNVDNNCNATVDEGCPDGPGLPQVELNPNPYGPLAAQEDCGDYYDNDWNLVTGDGVDNNANGEVDEEICGYDDLSLITRGMLYDWVGSGNHEYKELKYYFAQGADQSVIANAHTGTIATNFDVRFAKTGAEEPYDWNIPYTVVAHNRKTLFVDDYSFNLSCTGSNNTNGACQESFGVNLLGTMSEDFLPSLQEMQDGDYAYYVAVVGMELNPALGQQVCDLNVSAWIHNTTTHPFDMDNENGNGSNGNDHYSWDGNLRMKFKIDANGCTSHYDWNGVVHVALIQIKTDVWGARWWNYNSSVYTDGDDYRDLPLQNVNTLDWTPPSRDQMFPILHTWGFDQPTGFEVNKIQAWMAVTSFNPSTGTANVRISGGAYRYLWHSFGFGESNDRLSPNAMSGYILYCKDPSVCSVAQTSSGNRLCDSSTGTCGDVVEFEMNDLP